MNSTRMTRPRGKRLEARAALLRATRDFFTQRGFVEVETPVLVPSPGLDVHLDAFETDGPAALRFLSTSPEYQMKRLLSEGHSRIFQITRAFRKDERGERHNPEFTILEFYRAPGTFDDVLRDTEQLVARLTGGYVTLKDRTIRALPPFRRMRVTEAFQQIVGIDETQCLHLADNDEEQFYRILAFQVEPELAKFEEALFLTHYPVSQASLARKDVQDARFAERFELYIGGVEVCNGFGELTDPVEQRARFAHDQASRQALKKPVYPQDVRFLEALDAGIPAAGGNAVGLDRLFALALGEVAIGSVLSFDQDEL